MFAKIWTKVGPKFGRSLIKYGQNQSLNQNVYIHAKFGQQSLVKVVPVIGLGLWTNDWTKTMNKNQDQSLYQRLDQKFRLKFEPKIVDQSLLKLHTSWKNVDQSLDRIPVNTLTIPCHANHQWIHQKITLPNDSNLLKIFWHSLNYTCQSPAAKFWIAPAAASSVSGLLQSFNNCR